MKRVFAILLAAMLVFCLCACGGTPAQTTKAATEPPTEPPTEPIPDITVYAKIPEGWSAPGCWAWQDGGSDAFMSWPGEAMNSGAVWYSVNVPGWIDHVIINGNDGSVQTADLAVEAGRDVWVHVVNADYAFVHYEKPTEEQLNEELEKPALDLDESIRAAVFRGGYQVTGTKAITYHERLNRYSNDFVPEELQTDNPEEIYYVIVLKNKDKSVGYYTGLGGMKSAIKPGIQVRIQEVGTGKVLAESEVFEGGDPPESITFDHSGRGEEPDSALIAQWIEANLPGVVAVAPTELPYIPLNEDSLTEEEKAALEARELAIRLGLSYARLVEWLVEYEDYTQEAAIIAADNCGVDFKEIALQEAGKMLSNSVWTYGELVEYMVDILEFTEEEATYAADNCGADWNEQNMAVVQQVLDSQPDRFDGYYSYAGLVNHLVEDKGFTKEDATAAADSCGLDWMKQALLQAQFLTDDEDGWGYSERRLEETLRDKLSNFGYGFTRDEAAYAVENCNADWKKEAVKAVRFELEYGGNPSITKDEMIDYLTRYAGFTIADATYGAEKNGLK